MTQAMHISTLMPLLPELVLACSAMVLLMAGVIRGEASARGRQQRLHRHPAFLWRSSIVAVPAGRHELFGGSFVVDDFARFLKLLTLVGSAGALLLSLDYLTAEKQQKFEFGVLILLATLGMMMLISAADLIALYLGLELMSLSLYVVAASNRDNLQIDGSGSEIFRPRRAVVGHAALRRLADLRLHRHGEFRRHRQGGGAGRHRAHLRHRVPVCRLLLQDFGGAVPHVDARRLRRRADAGDRLLCRGAEGCRHRHLRARDHCRRFPASRTSGSRSWCSSPSPRWCSAPSRPSASATSSG